MKVGTAWVLTLSVFLSLFWPFLGQEGMFLDGVIYSALARNMAEGLGTFGTPHYTNGIFYEQPPLGLWLESLLFRLLGDHFWVEKLFSFLMALGNGALVVGIWRYVCQATGDRQRHFFSWLPFLIWAVSPIVFWCFQQNMLETTMSFFTLLAAWLTLRGLLEQRGVFFLFAGMMIGAGALCKGPVAFFPAAMPLMYALFWEKRRLIRGFVFSIVLILTALALIACCVRFIPGMDAYLDYYLHRQLFPTLAGVREKQVDFPLAFLPDLLGQLLLPLLLAGWALFRKKEAFDRIATFFLAMGLCGVLPLALSPKQSAHYLTPALPFFALGLSWITSSAFANLSYWNKFNTRRIRIASQTLLVLVLLSPLFFWGKYGRDGALITDIKKITGIVPPGSTLSVPGDWADKWLLHAYFERIGKLSLDQHGDHAFAVTQKNGTFRPEFEKITLDLNSFELFIKK